MRGRDGASTNVPIPPRDASDGRVSGLVIHLTNVEAADPADRLRFHNPA